MYSCAHFYKRLNVIITYKVVKFNHQAKKPQYAHMVAHHIQIQSKVYSDINKIKIVSKLEVMNFPWYKLTQKRLLELCWFQTSLLLTALPL